MLQLYSYFSFLGREGHEPWPPVHLHPVHGQEVHDHLAGRLPAEAEGTPLPQHALHRGGDLQPHEELRQGEDEEEDDCEMHTNSRVSHFCYNGKY